MEEKQDERIDPMLLFSPESQQDARNLTNLGYLVDDFRFCGHIFKLATIRPHMKFTIGPAMEPFRNTLVEPQVWAAMHVGLALMAIDGKRDFCPPTGDNELEYTLGRFEWVTGASGWMQPTIDYLFAEYVQLENRAAKVIKEFQSLSQAGRATSSLSSGSSTVSESSNEPIDSEPQL